MSALREKGSETDPGAGVRRPALPAARRKRDLLPGLDCRGGRSGVAFLCFCKINSRLVRDLVVYYSSAQVIQDVSGLQNYESARPDF